jgi:hypothetical protein
MSGPVDAYLDEMFDRLAGTGAPGRRALTEAEDHLRAAATEGVESGLPPQRAEEEAVTRFGRVDQVTQELRAGRRRQTALAVLSRGWLVAGLAVVGLGMTYLAATLGTNGRSVQEVPLLMYASGSDAGTTWTATSVTYTFTGAQSGGAALAGVIALVVGALILGGRVVTGRRTSLPPVTRGFLVAASAMFVLLSLLFIGWVTTERLFSGWQGPGLRTATIGAGAALLIAAGTATWSLVRARRSRSPVG